MKSFSTNEMEFIVLKRKTVFLKLPCILQDLERGLPSIM